MSACEIAKTMSLFEIDEALDLLIESATEQAAEGDISDELRNALSEYVDAFGEKVDRIANYIKAQEAFADAAKKEAGRLEARRRSAEDRVKSCKAFLCWFMTCRSLKHLKGRLNSVTLANNSVDTLVLDDCVPVSPVFQNVTISLPWIVWCHLCQVLPHGELKDFVTDPAASSTSVDRARIAETLRAGQPVAGARLVRGQHVRLS